MKRSNAKHVTNAWLKYWELYSIYDTTRDLTSMKVFFNAELPGAALLAYSHFMKTNHPNIPFEWRASSLVPSSDTGDNSPDTSIPASLLYKSNNTTALGDQYGVYKHNRNNWLMNDTNNGDATSIENLLDFEKRIGVNSEFGGVDLYSHDAGIDVSGDYNAQEISNAKVHLGCALAGFITLRTGGTFIAKQYTFFKSFTWNLILIYSTMFDEFHLSKPLTSKPYNSEIYLIGKGFRGLTPEIRKLLFDRLKNFNTGPFIPSEIINTTPISELTRFARIVFNQQTLFINENMELFSHHKGNIKALDDDLRDLKNERSALWNKLYPVSRINSSDQLASD
jgi:hypothetical protein